MIYSLLIYLLLIWQQYEVLNGYSFLFSSVKHKCRRIYVHSSKQQDTASPTFVSVRFINTIKNEDITVENVLVGANLLAVGDQAGVKLPRACRTGLCGSCTCDLQISDFQLETDDKTDSLLQKSGFTTIRACSTKCQAPPGMKEMVIDVYRMKTLTKKSASSQAQQDYKDPMARFSGDWERDFRSQWARTDSHGGERILGKGEKGCQYCAGVGRCRCYACDGSGRTLMGDNKTIQCLTCAGQKTVACGYCRGKGVLAKSF